VNKKLLHSRQSDPHALPQTRSSYSKSEFARFLLHP